MVNEILAFTQWHPVVNLFLILGAGVVVGKIKIGTIEIGSVTGVLLIGLMAGHFGLPVPMAALSMGFILFIYCVGVQAGPRFWGTFKQDGGRYLFLALAAAGSAIVLVFAYSRVFSLEQGFVPGLLAGSLASTPTLVAAKDTLAQGLKLSEGLTQQDVLANLSASYAITYVIGMAGQIIFISLLPKVFRIDLQEESQNLAEAAWIRSSRVSDEATEARETPTVRVFRVENEKTTIRGLDDREYRLDGNVSRIKRDEEIIVPDYAPEFRLGDIVALVGTQSAHDHALEIFGPEVFDQELLERSIETKSIILTKKNFEGKTIADMNFTVEDNCMLLRLTRAGMDIPCRPDLQLRRGDILVFSGTKFHLQTLAGRIGFAENRWQETDLVTFAFGIALGVLIGIPSITLYGINIGLGSAGGVLISGITFGMLHSRRVLVGRLPAAARNIVMELGLLMFIVGVAVNAGTTIVETFLGAGVKLILFGVPVTIVPILVCFFVGRYLLKMNAALMLGAITGAMTSTGALQQINKNAQSTLPTLGYVGAYAFANVILAIAGSVAMRF
jgi:putative transport protein